MYFWSAFFLSFCFAFKNLKNTFKEIDKTNIICSEAVKLNSFCILRCLYLCGSMPQVKNWHIICCRCNIYFKRQTFIAFESVRCWQYFSHPIKGYSSFPKITNLTPKRRQSFAAVDKTRHSARGSIWNPYYETRTIDWNVGNPRNRVISPKLQAFCIRLNVESHPSVTV